MERHPPGPPTPLSFADKWPSYIFERDLISDYAAWVGAKLFIVYGDSHGLQRKHGLEQDDGTSEKNGFAGADDGQDLRLLRPARPRASRGRTP